MEEGGGDLSTGRYVKGHGWKPPGFKSLDMFTGQMEKRGWTTDQITEAITRGKSFAAKSLVNKGNAATRYVHPTTGRSVVIGVVTREVLHVGADGFVY